MYKILHCELSDLKAIFALYKSATEYQKIKSHRFWQGFSLNLIEGEIIDGRIYKILYDKDITCIFSITYNDPLIWGSKDYDPSIYIHRIATNPDYRGKGFVKFIIEWCKNFGKKNKKKFIRMDAYGDNQNLIDYYIKCGFSFLGIITPESTDGLPKHYEGITLALFEIKIE